MFVTEEASFVFTFVNQYCPEDGFRNPANPMQGKGLNAVVVFFDLKSEESKAAFSEENR
jgi:hypothetical protein